MFLSKRFSPKASNKGEGVRNERKQGKLGVSVVVLSSVDCLDSLLIPLHRFLFIAPIAHTGAQPYQCLAMDLADA
jgi:hypothetical protein